MDHASAEFERARGALQRIRELHEREEVSVSVLLAALQEVLDRGRDVAEIGYDRETILDTARALVEWLEFGGGE